MIKYLLLYSTLLYGHISYCQQITKPDYINVSSRSFDLEEVPYKKVQHSIELLSIPTQTSTLIFDLYTPLPPSNYKRPLIVWIHGGGFVKGSRKDEAIQFLCQDFVSRGFVVASVDYRCYQLGEKLNVYRLMYKATQDVNDAIAYLIQRADEYNIAADYVFIGGISAGAITALNAGLWNNGENINGDSFINDYGRLNNQANNIKGVVSISGALPSLSLLEEGSLPAIISFHGEIDDTVKLGMGTPAFRVNDVDIASIYNNLIDVIKSEEDDLSIVEKLGVRQLGLNKAAIPVLYGPTAFHNILEAKGYKNELITFSGLGHTLCQEGGQKLGSYETILNNSLEFINSLLQSNNELFIDENNENSSVGSIDTIFFENANDLELEFEIVGGELLNTDNRSEFIVKWISGGENSINIYSTNEIGIRNLAASLIVNVAELPVILQDAKSHVISNPIYSGKPKHTHTYLIYIVLISISLVVCIYFIKRRTTDTKASW